MSAQIYVREVEKSQLNANEASGTIKEGDFVTLLQGGAVKKADPSNGDTIDGIVPHLDRGPHLPEHEWDYSAVQYESGEGPVPFYQLESGMEITEHANTSTAEAIGKYADVAFNNSLELVLESNANAVTDTIGKATTSALAAGEDIEIRVDL